jgi:tRNA pseudouridine32 synthase/23S rRNA pseudouridine746 synthase
MSFPFTNPFRYSPHPLVKKAAGEVMDMMMESQINETDGKMLGVLICRPLECTNIEQISHLHRLNHECEDNPIFYIAAFSGTIHGADGKVTSTIDGFVPPIIDLTDPKGYFKRKEAEISQLNRRISDLAASSKLNNLKASLIKAQKGRDEEIAQMQNRINFSKMRRDEIRTETADSNILEELIRESQFQKAELKRIKDKWKSSISEIESEIAEAQNEITDLKSLRASMSDELQKWIFESAIVHNASGESTSIWDLFQSQGLTPPGGTGDCAAPKLLEYAYKNKLQPLAMGEFWYGKSPETAVRTHGHFYPSCTSKCGPLLGYMMKGLDVEQEIKSVTQFPVIIHEDESIIVVEKPSGMPSVPGLDGRTSLQEWLNNRADDSSQHDIESQQSKSTIAVHRLDMDTSGVMVFAKTRDAEINLKKQFEEHTVRKTYIARLTGRPPQSADLESPEAQGIRHDSIDLPLSADYDERPRQKVDFKQGKPAHTEYEIVKENPDGTADILLHPHTGRTHQLRVHCAHTLGLGSPIVGDLLYGGHSAYNKEGRNVNRLCLHALSINFLHPVSNSPMEFISEKLTFSLEE